MRVLILDGYNVIHAIPELERQLDRSLEAAREALIGHCCAYQASRGDVQEIYVVFDGRETDEQAPTRRQPRVTVMFTPKREEADDRILHLIKTAQGRTEFVIVSNDTYVFNNARAHGARVIPAAEWYRWVQPKPAAPARTRRPAERPPSRWPRSAGRGGRPARGERKSTLSPRAAREITDAYQQELERRARGHPPTVL